MSLASLKSLLPHPSAENLIRQGWNHLHSLPGGKRVYSALIGRMAPYTGSIGAEVVELSLGRCKVVLRDRREVRNHLKSIHAIALANLAELAGNLALGYSMPEDARFIVAGFEIDYKKKARGTITAESDCPVPATSERAQYEVPVTLRDESGDEVAVVTLKTLVGPKKAS